MSDISYLPPLLQEIAEVAGLPAALAIQHDHGGCALYIPEAAPDDHWLTRCVGRKAADAIVERFGRCQITIPIGSGSFQKRAARSAAKLLEQGADRNEIARQVGVHVRTVSRIKRRLKDDDGPQGRLL